MKKREPPKIGDLVCLTYNTNTIGIVTEVSDSEVTTTKFRYKVEWLKDSDKVLSKQNGVNFGHYCDSVLLHLEEV
jgi:hypothetical protein